MSKQVVVLGMHRSGTSTVALILQALGVNMGDSLLGSSSGNPYGHAEDMDFLQLNNHMLDSVKSSWDFPPNNKKIRNSFHENRKDIEKMIKEKNKNELWGWKEPRTTLFAEKYHDLLDNPYYICVKRDELEVAKSLKKRNRMPIRKGIKLSRQYNSHLDSFLKAKDPQEVLNINFKDLHNPDNNIINQFINFLEINPTEEQIRNASQIIKPLDKVRGNREKLKKEENKNNFKKVFKHPVKAVKFIFREGWRHFKYHLGV
ncbi:sulfotransferase family protein [Virgibacillus sp. MSP4-1]|uniref:sulfotransferase n=1 Tax=Virgibacillus sp. MSP4-1 TaxID=2700081 RepID=UPI00039E5F8B|nr:sulfotransferase [Virgibacillus sp. MSP4-1]QHS23468.1 sulfotransferase family protein [Virgibacillus sp. MSP4-1]